MEKEDGFLVLEFQKGNKKALATLVKKWHVIFFKKAYWLVKDADIAKDIAQDNWQTIIAKLETLEKPSSFKSWALRIVYNKSLDVLRQQSKDRLKESKMDNHQIAVVDDDMGVDELKVALLMAVKQLPEKQQIVVRLFYTEDYRFKDMSDLLDISIRTTKSRLFHARENLKLLVKNNINSNKFLFLLK
jgi:RNA polymerase sigma-70 factor (ECF subfamily)